MAFELAVQCVRVIDRGTRPLQSRVINATSGEHSVDAGALVGWIDGMRAMVRSPYMLGIGLLYITLLAVSNTLIYFTQAAGGGCE
ncbi:MAG: hypothetical protein R3B67_13840 [Phycisphaerales bacterium]